MYVCATGEALNGNRYSHTYFYLPKQPSNHPTYSSIKFIHGLNSGRAIQSILQAQRCLSSPSRGTLYWAYFFKLNTIIIQIKQLKIGCYDLIPFYLLLHPPTYTGCGRLNHSLLNVNKVNHDFCALTLTAVAYRSTTAAVQSILSSANSGIKQKS